MDERRMLTHHLDASSAMPHTYSRDNLTALHSRIFRMLTAIRNFEFNPDDSNATRIYWENRDICDEPEEPRPWQVTNSFMKLDTSCMTIKLLQKTFLVKNCCIRNPWLFT